MMLINDACSGGYIEWRNVDSLIAINDACSGGYIEWRNADSMIAINDGCFKRQINSSMLSIADLRFFIPSRAGDTGGSHTMIALSDGCFAWR